VAKRLTENFTLIKLWLKRGILKTSGPDFSMQAKLTRMTDRFLNRTGTKPSADPSWSDKKPSIDKTPPSRT